jgi:hypothetical protein
VGWIALRAFAYHGTPLERWRRKNNPLSRHAADGPAAYINGSAENLRDDLQLEAVEKG